MYFYWENMGITHWLTALGIKKAKTFKNLYLAILVLWTLRKAQCWITKRLHEKRLMKLVVNRKREQAELKDQFIRDLDQGWVESRTLPNSLQELTKQIRDEGVSVKKVLDLAFSKAIKVTEETNCVTEFLFQEAYEMAAKLDKLPKDQRGPLHGVPISVKEHFWIKGRDSTVGLYPNLERPAEENADLGEFFIQKSFMN